MPVYILREGQSNIFKVGRTSGKVEAVVKRLRTGNSQTLSTFDVVETDKETACEAFFHRRLRSKRVEGGGWEFFQLEPEEMRDIIARFRAMFTELEEARSVVADLKQVESHDRLLEPTFEDKELLQRLLTIKEEQEYLTFECELIEAKLKRRIGDAAGLRGIATWKTQVTRCYDENLFKVADPDRYERLLERFHCLDTSAWKEECPNDYVSVQTTYFSPRVTRAFKLQKSS